MVKPPPRLVNPYVPELFSTLHLFPSSSSSSSSSGRRPADRARRRSDHDSGSRSRSRTTGGDGGDDDDDDDDDTSLEGGGAKRRPHQKTQHRPRGRLELRPIVLETSSSSSSASLSSPTSRPTTTSPATSIATGYAKVSMGSTTVLCHVHAPVPVASLSAVSNQYYDGGMSTDDNNNASIIMDEGTLAVHVHVAPHLTTAASSSTSSGSTTRPWERSLERQLHQSLLPSVPLRQYAKSAILLQLTIVSTGDNDLLGGAGSATRTTSSGQLLSPSVLAATLALSDAGVELYDVVTCGRVALVDGEILVDPDAHEEEEDATAVLTVALMNSWKEVTYWNQQGSGGTMTGERLDPAAVNRAVECCLEVCKKLHKVAVRHFQQQLATPPTADEVTRPDQQ